MHSPDYLLISFQTPLHLAVITNQPDVCHSLLVSGCDPTLVDNSGDTPLHIACRHGNLYCFSVVTQHCRSEHLHAAMAACNYNGEVCSVRIISLTVKSDFRFVFCCGFLEISRLWFRLCFLERIRN